MARLTTHRFFQVAELNDRAPHERIANYCRAIKAAAIGNNGAARYFTSQAAKWERIRTITTQRLIADMEAA